MADEIFAGAYAHDVNTPLSIDIHERGQDFELGYRWNRIAALGAIGGPSPYAFISVNDRGDTSFAAAGLSWKFGHKIYARPGIGLSVHTGPSLRYYGIRRTDLGSRVLFEPELGIGAQVTQRLSVEASWTHTSHAQIFGHQNPGIDMIGARVSLHLGK